MYLILKLKRMVNDVMLLCMEKSEWRGDDLVIMAIDEKLCSPLDSAV